MNVAVMPPRAAFALRMGDNALVLGQRMAEWSGRAPIVEEDIALGNVALDLIGQARLWLTLAGEWEGRGRGEDALAYGRVAHEFHNVLLVERPNGDFAHTTVRGFFFDTWHVLLLGALARSAEPRTAAIAAKAVREATYHARRGRDWIVRLGDGTAESRERTQLAVDALWPYTGELFDGDAIDDAAGASLDALRAPWLEHVGRALREATLTLPGDTYMHAGGKAGRHSEALSYLLAEMQSVRRSVPGERW